MNSHKDITRLLAGAQGGDDRAQDRLVEAIYAELHRLASSYMRRERPDHTLQPSALVNEAYLQLVGSSETDWQSRGHFYAAAAQTMRRILIDHARKTLAKKRGGEWRKVDLEHVTLFIDSEAEVWIGLDAALVRLEKLDPRQAKIVELRYFCGLTVEETAAALGISEKTVKRDWSVSRAWLQAELEGGNGEWNSGAGDSGV